MARITEAEVETIEEYRRLVNDHKESSARHIAPNMEAHRVGAGLWSLRLWQRNGAAYTRVDLSFGAEGLTLSDIVDGLTLLGWVVVDIDGTLNTEKK